MDQSYFDRLAAAFVRGKFHNSPAAEAHAKLFAQPLDQLTGDELQALIQLGLAHDLRLHKFKRTMDLARVRKALGIMRGLQPADLPGAGRSSGRCWTPSRASRYGSWTKHRRSARRSPPAKLCGWTIRRCWPRPTCAGESARIAGSCSIGLRYSAICAARRSAIMPRERSAVTRQIRAALIDLFTSYRARVRVVYVDAPLDVVMARNTQRENTVPARMVERLAGKLEAPDLTEAHAVEWVST
jgi:hypothetical protein